MCNSRLLKTKLGVCLAILCVLSVLSSRAATAVEDMSYRTADSLAVYLGMVPAQIVKRHPPGHPEQAMHGGAPKGPHQYHVVVAVFDSASGNRISDATVTAQVSGLGLSGSQAKLEPMEIAGTISYGGFFNLPGCDFYTIRLTIGRPGSLRPVVLDFKYDHRRS